MVRILALLLALWSSPALAQATFTTVISPTTLGTSPLAVTFGTSPFGVICVSGCAGGASPSSILVINTPTVSLSTSAPYVQQGTNPWITTSSTSPIGVVVTNSVLQVNVAGGSTLPVSVNGPMFVSQGTSPWAIAGGVNINNTPTVSLASSPFVSMASSPLAVSLPGSPATITVNSAFVSNLGPTITFADSTTTANAPTAVAGFPFLWNGTNWDRTVGTSKLGAYVNVTNNGSTFTVAPTTSPLAVTLPLSPIVVGTLTSGAIVNVMAAGTSPLAIVPLTSPMAVALPGSPATVTLTNSPGVVVTSGAVVVNSAAGTSPLAVTLSSSPTAIAEQNGLAYPNRANWKQGSVTTTGTASAVVIPAPAANKLYITALQCWRSDAGTSPITMKFNDPAAQFTVAVANGQTNLSLNPALVMSATTSLQFSASTSLTSVGCNAQGYNAP